MKLPVVYKTSLTRTISTHHKTKILDESSMFPHKLLSPVTGKKYIQI